MSDITYIKGDALDAPQDRLLLHACNCKGNWGRGIAKQLADKYPLSYAAHKLGAPFTVGNIQIINIDHRVIVCLFTSKGYGYSVDCSSVILQNTSNCLATLAKAYKKSTITIASPKINAGLFNVPWEHTERLINTFLEENKNIKWEVYIK